MVASETHKDWMLYFAPDGQLARMEYVGEGMGGAPARMVEIYGDWKPVGAVQWPHSTKTLSDDKPVMEGTADERDAEPDAGRRAVQEAGAVGQLSPGTSWHPGAMRGREARGGQPEWAGLPAFAGARLAICINFA